MGRKKTGGAPKRVEFLATFTLDGETKTRSGRTEAKLIDSLPAGARVQSVVPTRWQAYYWEDGVKRWATGATADEVTLKAGGVPPCPASKGRLTLAEYGRALLRRQRAAGAIQQGTLDLELGYVDAHLCRPGAVGLLALEDVTQDACQEWLLGYVEAAEATGRGASTAVHLHAFLRKLWNAVATDPQWRGRVAEIRFSRACSVHAVTVPEMLRERREERAFTAADWNAVEGACADAFERAMVGLAMCGLRPPGEVVGQRWELVDAQNAQMLVKGQVRAEKNREGKYRRVVKRHTKTKLKDPRRTTAVPIPPRALALLLSAKALGSEWVVPSPVDPSVPMHPSTAGKRWKALLARAGVAHVRMYATRHAVTTALVQRGADPKTLQLVGGWTSAATALQAYARHSTEAARAYVG